MKKDPFSQSPAEWVARAMEIGSDDIRKFALEMIDELVRLKAATSSTIGALLCMWGAWLRKKMFKSDENDEKYEQARNKWNAVRGHSIMAEAKKVGTV